MPTLRLPITLDGRPVVVEVDVVALADAYEAFRREVSRRERSRLEVETGVPLGRKEG